MRISEDNRHWLLQTFALGRANYWFCFVADLCTALFFLAWDLEHGFRLWQVAAAFGFGFFLWGLTEYVFHRWVYHQPDSIFGDGHRIHHGEAETLIAMPWFLTTGTMLLLWAGASWYLGVTGFASVVAGWLVGFVWYSLVHHSHHHWDFRLARRLKAYHRVHHHFPDSNYGVTMRFWDIVFGTQYRRPAAELEAGEGRARVAVRSGAKLTEKATVP